MIGFGATQKPDRKPIYDTNGTKMGYITQNNIAQDVNGRTLFRILRYKNGAGPYSSASACGGTIVRPWD